MLVRTVINPLANMWPYSHLRMTISRTEREALVVPRGHLEQSRGL